MKLYFRDDERRVRIRLRNAAFRKQSGLCFWCHEPMTLIGPDTDPNDPKACTADHHPKPVHAGGMTVAGNIVAACRKCNSERHPELNRSRGKQSKQPIYSVGEESSERWPWLEKLQAWGRGR